MEFDALMLSRIQFAFTIAFHIIFPAFTIGLASWLAALEFNWLRTGNPLYRNLFRFWVKVFAVSFGLGVVSGIVMSYQFGTNWSRYSEFTGNVLGPVIAYEVITAFFLEAAFLGIMLFGWEKVGDRLHFFATCMVALGTLISAFWILSANSWMQTPDGFAIENGKAVPVDWFKVVFNPSFPLRYAHMVMGCYLTTAFAVAGMSAWMLLRHPHDAPAAKLAGSRRSMSMALWFATIFVPVQIVIGDLHGLGVLKYQPTKLAAIEGNWDRMANMPLRLFALPDEVAETNHYEIAIPKIGSWVLTHAFDGVVPGLKEVPPDERPPVWPVFFSFRIMVGIGFAMLGIGLWSLYLRWKGTLFTNRLFLTAAMIMTPSGFGAVLFGWFTAEIGRQPYVVYGHLRTADAVSPIAAGAVTASLLIFIVVYAFVFGFGSYYLAKLLRRGPDPVEDIRGDDLGKKPKRPFSVPDEAIEGRPGHRALPAR
ncbi:MAG: cytochrome ubiquinol oxidase subunit I [Microvirga sp.]|jgi:cytochrome bd ubiquinol oxidase subunit I|uniref:Cytochrome ubiquinol oxidase subunit I n=1 Tax=Microvirga tunisiensis TaxID=2108360 RepID=A0A5N7MGA7_9HYPH|nr:cytochrome ubiquinol oxidase subunit I [Microvirga tunisiensis]MPR07659.1 cytochrome ubiquinol oxidase subunit I [Microvirga tunisiensis]MPR26091.1 cytochrome ubiquinol oxidase subunit I [Microvirga tunisiensis]